ncbi:MAG TPA: hypothetical protein VIM12_16070 [Noviherbaspirillum sp.]|uniref:hypothetical protein n=1 Tax=Noviherbaspirillum sp. TaxID=1926288 RepID=UPI002F935B84
MPIQRLFSHSALLLLLACAGIAQADTTTTPLQQLPQLDKDEIQARRPPGFAAYLLRGNDRTIVLDFPSVREQGAMFGRVILYIERDGTPRDRVMSFPETEEWLVRSGLRLDTLTVGNNFRTEELARFFNAVRKQGDRLTADEKFLHDWLLRMQLLKPDGRDVAAANDAIVVTVPQASTVDGCATCTVLAEHRAAILEHELAHARFSTDGSYHAHVLRFWNREMSDSMRERFTQFLRKRGYDADNRELLANEMQAFLMHTPHPGMFSANAVGLTEEELADLRRRFDAGLPRMEASAGQ